MVYNRLMSIKRNVCEMGVIVEKVFYEVNLKKIKRFTIPISIILCACPIGLICLIYPPSVASLVYQGGVAMIGLCGWAVIYGLTYLHELMHYKSAKRYGQKPTMSVNPNVSMAESAVPSKYIIVCLMPLVVSIIPFILLLFTSYKILWSVVLGLYLSSCSADIYMAWKTYRMRNHYFLVKDKGTEVQFISTQSSLEKVGLKKVNNSALN